MKKLEFWDIPGKNEATRLSNLAIMDKVELMSYMIVKEREIVVLVKTFADREPGVVYSKTKKLYRDIETLRTELKRRNKEGPK